MLLVWLGSSVALFAVASGAGWVPPIHDGRDLVLPATAAGLAGLAPLSIFWGLYTYNTLVAYRHRTRNAWRLIDIDLKNRYDLVPRLVEVVKGAATHERELLERLSSLRKGYLEGGVRQRVEQEGEAVEAVARVVALGEAYPELGANDLYRHLTDILQALEEKIAHDRSFYNENATEYRDIVESFPHLLIARLFGFEAFPLFRVGAGEDHMKKDSTRKPAT